MIQPTDDFLPLPEPDGVYPDADGWGNRVSRKSGGYTLAQVHAAILADRAHQAAVAGSVPAYYVTEYKGLPITVNLEHPLAPLPGSVTIPVYTHPAPTAAVSVDSPEFRRLMEAYVTGSPTFAESNKNRAALITHIQALINQAAQKGNE